MPTLEDEVDREDPLANGLSMGKRETQDAENNSTGQCLHICFGQHEYAQGSGSRGVPWRHLAVGGRVGTAARRADGKNLANITHYWDLLAVAV